MGRRARHAHRRDARRRDELHPQPLAALPDARLPAVRARRLLPGGRRVRLSRPVAGRDGADGRSTRRGARAHRPRLRASVPGRRRPALVASAVRARRAHALLRRSRVPAVRRRALRRDDRRCGRARRDRAVHRRTAGAADARGPLLRARVVVAKPRRSTSIARARSTRASRSARTACR